MDSDINIIFKSHILFELYLCSIYTERKENWKITFQIMAVVNSLYQYENTCNKHDCKKIVLSKSTYSLSMSDEI